VNNTSAIVLHKGASLFIASGSQLEISRGGSLIVEKGVSIVLDSGTIQFQGALHLETDAVFHPQGFGRYSFSDYAYVAANKGAVFHIEDATISVATTLKIPA
jgi:hypothetical protein